MDYFSAIWFPLRQEGTISPPVGISVTSNDLQSLFGLPSSSDDVNQNDEKYLPISVRHNSTDSGVCVNILNECDNHQYRESEDEWNCEIDSNLCNNMAKTNAFIPDTTLDMKQILQAKAERHKNYYRVLCGINNDLEVNEQVADSVRNSQDNTTSHSTPSEKETATKQRQRRTGVFQLDDNFTRNSDIFVSVKQMRDKYLAMLQNTNQNLQTKENATHKVEELNSKHQTLRYCKQLSHDVMDDSFLAPPPSGYCSSSASGTSDDERERTLYKQLQLRRSGSSDSAVELNHSDDEKDGSNTNILSTEYQYIRSPYSPRGSVDHSNVPSKTLIEAKCVPYPLDRKFSRCGSETALDDDKYISDSRRPSCFTDDGEEVHRFRCLRTPSVVVSDYSDDIVGVGLSLEDIEFFRTKRRDASSSPDSSLHSSCSNLNYCGSTISSLDTEYIFRAAYRKSSDCSSCSNFSGDEDTEVDIPEPPKPKFRPSGWRKLRNIVQWTPFFQTYKKQSYPWVQLAGHQGNFKAGPDQGTILKKLSVKEEKCFKILMNDVLRPYVPEYKGHVSCGDGEGSFIQLQDLLSDFNSPCVMDCKIGVRTYLEEELAKAKEKPKLRKDMYEKMIQIDPMAPTDDENRLKAVTKPRYMVWRETISSTALLGFRIEGVRKADGTSTKDFKTTKTKEQIMEVFSEFTDDFSHAIPKYIQRLKAIKDTLETSQFFRSHEVIGSSLLFVHDRYNANVWLIDFAKTLLLPDEVSIDHNTYWKVGNHEDGYLIGINNLINIFVKMLEKQRVCITPPLSLQDPVEYLPDSDLTNDA